MPHLLYISDVFCPWCFGFAPVLARLRREHPELPLRLLAGSLVDTPKTVAGMKAHSPTIRDFFLRLEKTTGRSAAGFIRLLDEDSPIRLHSPEINRLLTAMKRLSPLTALQQMELFQTALYEQGRDILNPDVIRQLLPALGMNAESCLSLLKDPSIEREAEEETGKALDILDEFLVYPTLFLEDETGRTLLARGYTPFPTVEERLEAALAGMKKAVQDNAEGAACGPDGCS